MRVGFEHLTLYKKPVPFSIPKCERGCRVYTNYFTLPFKYRNREFWCRGYFVDTVGKNTKAIDKYISNQLREDELSNQMTLEEPDPFTGNK